MTITDADCDFGSDFDYRAMLDRRLMARPDGWLDVRSTLRHFALINYTLPPSRLTPCIPTDRFAIATFDIGGERRAMLSTVPFLDVDFHFARLPRCPDRPDTVAYPVASRPLSG